MDTADLMRLIDRSISDLDGSERIVTELALAAALCERAGYDLARNWPADRVGALLLASAQIERTLIAAADRKLD